MSDENTAPPTRKKLGCLPLAGGTLVIVLIFLVVLFYAASSRATRTFEAELERLRARGKPTNAAELKKMIAPRAGEADITGLWLQAIEPFDTQEFNLSAEKIPIVGASESTIPPPGEPWDEEALVEPFLTQQQSTLDRLHHAASQEGVVRYPVKYEDGISALLPHVNKVRGAARLLALDAHRHARQGDAEATTRNLHAMFRAAATLDREPLLVSQLVRNAIQGMICEKLSQFLPHVQFAPADYRLLLNDLAAARNRLPMQQAWSGERIIGLQLFQNPEASQYIEGAPHTPANVLWQITRGDDLVSYLQFLERIEEAIEEPWPQALAQLQTLEQDLQALAGSGVLNRSRHMFTLLMLPASKSAMQSGARNDALLAAAEAAIGVEMHRRQHGQPPVQLSDLVPRYLPAVPLDPFDGKPLRYLVQPHEYLIYSIGVDAKDDGGAGYQKGLPDVVFRVALP